MSLIFSGVIEMDMLIVIIISAAYRYFIVAFGLARTGHNLDVGELFETRTLYFDAETAGECIMVRVSMALFVLHSDRNRFNICVGGFFLFNSRQTWGRNGFLTHSLLTIGYTRYMRYSFRIERGRVEV